MLCASLLLSGMTVVSMAPNITESVYFLEADSILKGRTLYCDYPKAAENADVTGTFIEMDYEKILLLSPDIVIFSGNLTSKQKTFLDEYKIKYVDIKMERACEVIPALRTLDSLINHSSMKDKIDSLDSSFKPELSARTSKIFLEMSSKPLVSANKNSYVGSILEMMGFSVFSDSNYSSYSAVSQEEVIKFNPTAIIVFHDESKVSDRLGWENVNAVKNKRIIYLNKEETDILSRPGPRISEALKVLEDIREKFSL